MKWLVKAAAGKALSALPGGAAAHYLLQRWVTRTLPPTLTQFRARARCAGRHLAAFLQASGRERLTDAVFLEVGAGWELTIPLVFRSLGVSRQLVIDVRRLVRADLLGVTLDRARDLTREDVGGWATLIPDPARLPREPPPTDRELPPWLAAWGIDYRAPCDARATGLPDGSVDCVTNTATLEHVPTGDLPPIFREMFRLLRPTGVLTCIVDLTDHYSRADRRITPWHFLRYSEKTWRLVNNDVLYQNRLRASAYVDMATAAGFEVQEAALLFPPDLDLRDPRLPRVHPSFTRWRNSEDLLATELHLVCRKPSGDRLGGETDAR